MASRKEWDELAAELKRQGWQVDPTGRGHLKAVPPTRNHGIVHFSHSEDPHAYQNTVRDLRKRGFVWPPPSKNEQAGSSREEPPVSAIRGDEWIDDHNAAVAAAEPPPPPPETHEAKMDRLFNELKDAKVNFALMTEHKAECVAKLNEAQRIYQEACTELEKATAALQAKREEFNVAFEAA